MQISSSFQDPLDAPEACLAPAWPACSTLNTLAPALQDLRCAIDGKLMAAAQMQIVRLRSVEHMALLAVASQTHRYNTACRSPPMCALSDHLKLQKLAGR